MARVWVAGEMVVELLEMRTTGCLRRWRVRKRPVVGSARTIRSLKELVPKSMAANRLLAGELTVGNRGSVVAIEGKVW